MFQFAVVPLRFANGMGKDRSDASQTIFACATRRLRTRSLCGWKITPPLNRSAMCCSLAIAFLFDFIWTKFAGDPTTWYGRVKIKRDVLDDVCCNWGNTFTMPVRGNTWGLRFACANFVYLINTPESFTFATPLTQFPSNLPAGSLPKPPKPLLRTFGRSFCAGVHPGKALTIGQTMIKADCTCPRKSRARAGNKRKTPELYSSPWRCKANPAPGQRRVALSPASSRAQFELASPFDVAIITVQWNLKHGSSPESPRLRCVGGRVT